MQKEVASASTLHPPGLGTRQPSVSDWIGFPSIRRAFSGKTPSRVP